MRRAGLRTALLTGWLIAACAAGAPPTPPTPALGGAPDALAGVFQRGNESFRRGLELSGSAPERARAEFARAAAAFETVSAAVHNERLLTNLANAYLLAGDTARAVLNYRRALRLAPGDRAAAAGLEAARQRVGVAAPRRGSPARAWASAWRAYVPAAWVGGAAGVAWAAGWALVGLRPRSWRWGPALAACWGTAAAGAGLVVGERLAARASDEAVVVRDGVPGLNGPAAGVYPPTFDKPLAAGVEVRLLEHRAGWVRVALADGRETWVPEDAVERV